MTLSRGCSAGMPPDKEFYMRGLLSILFLIVCCSFLLIWRPEWQPFLDFAFQLVLFIILGKLVLIPAFYVSVLLKNWKIFLFGISLMISVFIRWMIVLLTGFRVAKHFPIVEYGWGIPYSLACAAVVFIVLLNIPYMQELLRSVHEAADEVR